MRAARDFAGKNAEFSVQVALCALWSLLRGRKPVIVMPRFGMPPGRQWGFPSAARHPAASRGEVVDVEVREVPDQAPKIDRP